MTKQAYAAFATELAALEQRTGLYLADENVDAENAIEAGAEYGSDEFWAIMFDNAQMNAGIRAEAAGHDINALIGRTVY